MIVNTVAPLEPPDLNTKVLDVDPSVLDIKSQVPPRLVSILAKVSSEAGLTWLPFVSIKNTFFPFTLLITACSPPFNRIY